MPGYGSFFSGISCCCTSSNRCCGSSDPERQAFVEPNDLRSFTEWLRKKLNELHPSKRSSRLVQIMISTCCFSIAAVAAASNIYGAQEFGEFLASQVVENISLQHMFGLIAGGVSWAASTAVYVKYVNINIQYLRRFPFKERLGCMLGLGFFASLPMAATTLAELEGYNALDISLVLTNVAASTFLFRSGIAKFIQTVQALPCFPKDYAALQNKTALRAYFSSVQSELLTMAGQDKKKMLEAFKGDVEAIAGSANLTDLLEILFEGDRSHPYTTRNASSLSSKIRCILGGSYGILAWFLGGMAVAGYPYVFETERPFNLLGNVGAIITCMFFLIPNWSLLSTGMDEFPAHIGKRLRASPTWWGNASSGEQGKAIVKVILELLITTIATFNSAGLAYKAGLAWFNPTVAIIAAMLGGLGTIGLNGRSTEDLLNNLFGSTWLEDMISSLDEASIVVPAAVKQDFLRSLQNISPHPEGLRLRQPS